MGTVDHPNCVKLWDVFQEKDRLCLVLDLCKFYCNVSCGSHSSLFASLCVHLRNVFQESTKGEEYCSLRSTFLSSIAAFSVGLILFSLHPVGASVGCLSRAGLTSPCARPGKVISLCFLLVSLSSIFFLFPLPSSPSASFSNCSFRVKLRNICLHAIFLCPCPFSAFLWVGSTHRPLFTGRDPCVFLFVSAFLLVKLPSVCQHRDL